MNKKLIMKGILVLVVIALLSIVFAGCGLVISTKGTVYITVDTRDDYDIYMDGINEGYTDWSAYFTIYNVPVGYHTFVADGYYFNYYGSKYRYISSGANYVIIYTN